MIQAAVLFQTNPLTPLSSQGSAVGSAVICVGLFIWAQIEAYKSRTAVEKTATLVASNNSELKLLLTAQSGAQTKLAESVTSMAEAIKGTTELSHQQLDLIREVLSEQKLQSLQMMTITNGFQRTLEQLIDVVAVARDKD